MKIYGTLLLAFFLLNISACRNDRHRDFITGTFINYAEGDFSKAHDTLVISKSDGNEFSVHRKTGFSIRENGKYGNPQFETEEWRLIYDEGTKVLTETKKGKLIYIYPDSGCLKVGRRKYKKQ